MDFFEALRQEAYNKFQGIFDDRASPPYSDGYMFGVGATIEALKDMMAKEVNEMTASGYGPFDLKTKAGRSILRGGFKPSGYWKRMILQTLFAIHIRFACGNLHNVLDPRRWHCKCS